VGKVSNYLIWTKFKKSDDAVSIPTFAVRPICAKPKNRRKIVNLQISSLYAAILAFVLIALTYNVIKNRALTHISILHGDNLALATKIRQHGNFTEFVPMALILMALAENTGANTIALHVAGGLLVTSRIAHPFGLDPVQATKPLRIFGGLGAHVSILLSAALIPKAQFSI
jgi:uncharacterized membrane protein YecN with MAPEG domain